MIHAREDDLQILRVAELAILVCVEELNEIVAVRFAGVCHSVFAQEIEEVEWSHETILVPIQPLETTIWLKIKIGA